MSTSGEQPAAPVRTAKPGLPSGIRRRSRGRRGGRGRSRPPLPHVGAAHATGPTDTTVPPVEPARAAAPLLEATARLTKRLALESAPQISAISQAIDEVMQIVDSLRRVLDQMEEVLELVELAERQKLGDEQEIESLRRALRQLQRPRGPRSAEDEGHHS